MRKLKYTQTNTVDQRVELEGEDISRLVRSVSIEAEAGHLPTVTLELAVFEIETAAGDAKIHLAQGTAELLERFGWTPPAGEGD